jgi:uncharacterized cupredoxin-like copper-binding protein
MKRILSLLVLSAATGTLLFAALPAGARTTATTVKVTAKEYKFILSTKTARHGTVIFKVTNKGKIKHDFKIAGKKTPMLRPGKTVSLTVTLAKGKTYTYICTVPGHAQLGMKGKFKVT